MPAKKVEKTRYSDKELVEFQRPPSEVLSCPESGVFDVPAEKIYRYIVPFGLAYRNIVDVLHLFEEGAIGRLHAPDRFVHNDASGLLGSHFPLTPPFMRHVHGANGLLDLRRFLLVLKVGWC